jgi:feruloyl-CoA synthase
MTVEYRQDAFERVEVVRTACSGGELITATTPFVPYFATVAEMLRSRASKTPKNIFLRERTADGWRELSYGEAQTLAHRLAASLLSRGLSVERPLAILSGNSINHALLSLAAMSVGVPVAPVSVAYSQFQDLTRLRGILESLTPGLVYADDVGGWERALH